MRSIAKSGKSPLSPPFGFAQGMLFQRGGFELEREGFSSTYSEQLYFLLFKLPTLKKGDYRGI
jgi:hypothetical protein